MFQCQNLFPFLLNTLLHVFVLFCMYDLWNPRLGKGIPFTFTHLFSCQGNTIFKWNTLPSIFHEISNVLVIVTIGVGHNITVVLSPKLIEKEKQTNKMISKSVKYNQTKSSNNNNTITPYSEYLP